VAFHLTARMAWHDNKWNGAICCHPERNDYCVGSHSLLSERLAREKKVEIEVRYKKRKIDQIPNYQPPCFWSSNAFSGNSAKITHVHPFTRFKGKIIKETLHHYSIFTWPFRLSFNHSQEKIRREGYYPPDLEKRIRNFVAKFKPGESLVFYYLNYDNPISADEYKYALVGCAPVKSIGESKNYAFSRAELSRLQRKHLTKNFKPINWAIQVTCNVAKGILLPYHEYLNHIESHPEDEEKLREMRVLIEEPELIPRFKYVAEELNEDHCIYLLYKLQKALSIIKEHGIVNVNREEKLIENYLRKAWRRRGLYPALGKVLDLVANPESDYEGEGDKLVSFLRRQLPPGNDLMEEVFKIVKEPKPIPPRLRKFSKTINAARVYLRDHPHIEDVLKKLSLFSLTKFQLRRIVFPDMAEDEPHPFGGKVIAPQQIADNPYLLCEVYAPVSIDPKRERIELDREELRDGPISIFTIDIGMFPDENYLVPNYKLQNLSPGGPERLRALIIEYLRQIGAEGHCFATLDAIYENVIEHPLFYKQLFHGRRLALNKQDLISPRHLDHFKSRLSVVPENGEFYFYLREVEYAEDLVEKVVTSLTGRKRDHKIDLDWIDTYIAEESKQLQEIPDFDVEQFKSERKMLLTGALQKSFYVITGKPGSGKTQVLAKIIEKLREAGEDVTVLAPTGKATLRLKDATQFEDAQTIDMFIWKAGYGNCLDNFENILTLRRTSETPVIQNLIIDECSMVDLQQLSIVFALLELEGHNAVKRVILVGDENQLPPIGYGRPFHDIVAYIKGRRELRSNHLIRLVTNCRQKFDKTILEVADIFTARNRYYQPMLERLEQGGVISEGLTVEQWNTREELFTLINAHLQDLIRREIKSEENFGKSEGLNLLFGLSPEGLAPVNHTDNLKLDVFQLITPYRAGFFGTIGLNQLVRNEYKKPYPPHHRGFFRHSDKVIRVENWYWWDRNERKRILGLSNGSIGVVCDRGKIREWYFLEVDKPIPDSRIDDEEKFELAFAITVHKAQGSEFDNVFVVLPRKRSLLSKELVYTALTRSTGKLTVFVQRTGRESPLRTARDRSFVLTRNASLFSKPIDAQKILEPEPGKRVRSKIEYIIYLSLKEHRDKGRLLFNHEVELKLANKPYPIRPDFTVYVDGKTYYWEHLGELDGRDYFERWEERRRDYEVNGWGDILITTDDLGGVKEERIQQVIEDIINGTLQFTKDSPFSNHHYPLYD
jgi:exodeoxyribonuclease V alpha subunit